MESPDNPALYWGRVLEEVVAREYSLRTRTKVRRKTVSSAIENTPGCLPTSTG